jgi:hypothetical protein
MFKILYRTTKRQIFILFQKIDINLKLDDLNVIEDSRISFEISIANYRVSQYE